MLIKIRRLIKENRGKLFSGILIIATGNVSKIPIILIGVLWIRLLVRIAFDGGSRE